MNCADALSAMDRLAAGELTPGEFVNLQAHVTGCDACRGEYERLSQVEAHLERRALPQHRQALLEAELFARLGVAPPASAQANTQARVGANVLRPARWDARRIATVALPLAASIALGVLVAPRLLSSAGDGYQARGGAKAATYGVRAFCVGAEGSVSAEAGPGETLRCPLGSRVQFSHTAEGAASLTIVGGGEQSEPLTFFPLEGQPATIPAGTDVPLSHSTPVTADWLNRPVPVTATFRGADGEVVGRTELVLEPAN